MAIVCFILVAVGVLMILAGVYMSLEDWKKKHAGGKLADAVKTYPAGQQLIVWGIVVLIIAGVFGGLGTL